MSENKNSNNTLETITDGLANAAQNLGLIMMATATTLGLVELGNHETVSKAVLASQPIFAAAENSQELNPVRREREESGPHYTSYGVSQRIPGRTGKL